MKKKKALVSIGLLLSLLAIVGVVAFRWGRQDKASEGPDLRREKIGTVEQSPWRGQRVGGGVLWEMNELATVGDGRWKTIEAIALHLVRQQERKSH